MSEVAQGALDFATSDERAGFRLHRLELYNWGTFHQRIWSLSPAGDHAIPSATVRLIAPELRRPIGIIHRQRKVFTPTAAKFVELLKEVQLRGPEES